VATHWDGAVNLAAGCVSELERNSRAGHTFWAVESFTRPASRLGPVTTV